VIEVVVQTYYTCNLDQLLAPLERTKLVRFEDVFSLRNRYTLLGRRIVLSFPLASSTMSIIPALILESEGGATWKAQWLINLANVHSGWWRSQRGSVDWSSRRKERCYHVFIA